MCDMKPKVNQCIMLLSRFNKYSKFYVDHQNLNSPYNEAHLLNFSVGNFARKSVSIS